MLDFSLENFFLPPNSTFSDSYDTPKWHILLPIPLSIVLIIARMICEAYIFGPIGKSLGIQDKKPDPPQFNKTLENFYQKNHRLNENMVKSILKQTDMTRDELRKWWQLRRAQDKPTTLRKFCDACFKGFLQSITFYYALYIAWDKSYLINFYECFTDYPNHQLGTDIWLLYMLVLSQYWFLTAMQVIDKIEIDFYQIFVHHVLVIVLLSFMYLARFHRFFVIIIALHDITGHLILIIKALKYTKFDQFCQILFVIFFILWIPTRLIIFPIHLSIFMFGISFNAFPAYYVIVLILIALQYSHIYWTKIISKIITESLKGNLEGAKEVHSDQEE